MLKPRYIYIFGLVLDGRTLRPVMTNVYVSFVAWTQLGSTLLANDCCCRLKRKVKRTDIIHEIRELNKSVDVMERWSSEMISSDDTSWRNLFGYIGKFPVALIMNKFGFKFFFSEINTRMDVLKIPVKN